MGDFGNLIASALLAGFEGNLLPALLLARSILFIEPHNRPTGQQGDDRGGAEFDRLLEDQVHVFPLGNSLGKRDRRPQRGCDCFLADSDAAVLSVHLGEHCIGHRSRPVEKRHRIANLQA